MGNQDFLISFSVDGTQAIRMMEQIGERAVALEARLNSLGRGGGGAGGSMGGNILNNLGLGSAQVGASTRAMSDLEEKTVSLKNHVAEMASARQAGATLGYKDSAGSLKTESIATQQLAQNYGALATKYGVTTAAGKDAAAQSARFSKEAQGLTIQSKAAAAQLDDTGQAFGRHTRRIFEAILVYAAFGKAVQAVQAGVALIIDIDRESRRLEAVLNIDTSQGAAFIQGLGQIASDTVTPFEHLVAEADSAAAAFLDIEDPIKRSAAALELMRDAGKFTTVTQRDLGTEVGNLTAIMKQFGIPIENLDDFLGKLVVAGGNSSVVIAGLTDAMRISAIAAEDAGLSLNGFEDILLALESTFLIATKRTGSEVGNIFKLLITRMADPDVINAVEKITGGMIKLRDATGAIRNPLVVLSELNALLEKGVISATEFSDVFEALTPPLQPARLADFKLIARELDTLGPRIQQISRANVGSLDELVKKINDALGPQFQKLIIDAQRAFVNLFGPGFLSMGQQFIDVLRAIGTILGALPTGVLTSVVGFTALLVSFRLLAYAGKGIGTMLGMGGLQGSFFRLGASATVAGAEVAAAGTTVAVAGTGAVAAGTAFKLFGTTMFRAGGMVAGLVSQLMILLPLIAAWMAIDFGRQVGEAQAGLRTQIGGQIEGMSLEELKAFREKVQAEKDKLDQSGTLNPLDIPQMIGAALAAATLGDSLKEIDAAMAGVVVRGGEGVAVIDDLSDSFITVDQRAKSVEEDLARQAANVTTGAAWRKMQEDSDALAESLAGVTDAHKQAEAAMANTTSLTDEVSSALGTLRDRYRDGAISAQEYATGQSQVARASELAGKLVAGAGAELAKMPLLANAAGKGMDGMGINTEELTASIFDLIIQAGNSLPVIEAEIQRILGIGAAAVAAAAMARANPIVISTIILPSVTPAGKNIPRGLLRNEQDQMNDPFPVTGYAIAQAGLAAMRVELEKLFRTFTSGSSTAFGTGPAFAGGSTAAGPSANVIDIGDLPVEQLAQAIAKAQALQAAMPGASAAAKDSILNIIKDAAFLQQVVGLDDALLREAISELTEVEKARLDAIEEAKKVAADAEAKRLDSLKSTLVDVGDMPAEKLAEAIIRGRALQAAIPGADELAKSSVLSIIKDAAFLQQVVGLDDTLLRKAIEELADIEKARLDEERAAAQADAILSNLSVLSGPMGALISAPTLFGAGGSIGAGMNFDPNSTGGFTVNIDIGEVSNLTPEQISTLIENAVRNAIQSALHQQGG